MQNCPVLVNFPWYSFYFLQCEILYAVKVFTDLFVQERERPRSRGTPSPVSVSRQESMNSSLSERSSTPTWLPKQVRKTSPLMCLHLLLLRSSAIALGFTFLGEIFAYVTFLCVFFYSTVEVVTFRLHGWCMLDVFLLPAFTHLRHECQDL